jgi:hypothetical protein
MAGWARVKALPCRIIALGFARRPEFAKGSLAHAVIAVKPRQGMTESSHPDDMILEPHAFSPGWSSKT